MLLLLLPPATPEQPADDLAQDRFASFFDTVVIPARQQQLIDLDPRVDVSSETASELQECSLDSQTVRLLREADHRLIILGGGPAGLSAAIYAARAEMEPLVIARDGGQLESTSTVDNYPGFEDGIDAVEMVQRLSQQATRFGARFQECEVESVETSCRPFRVTCSGGETLTSSALVVATGARAKWLGVEGEQEYLSRGVHTCATCDGYFYKHKHAAVVGGGDTAMEQALFLARLCSKVTIIHRRGSFRASKAMATRALSHPNIDVLWDTTVKRFVSEDGEQLSALLLETTAGQGATEERLLPVDGAFVAVRKASPPPQNIARRHMQSDNSLAQHRSDTSQTRSSLTA